MPDFGEREEQHANFMYDALEGLSQSSKMLPGKYLWDETGSVLYDRICDSEDYYVARRETALIAAAASEIAAIVGAGASIVEFGSGASHKIRLLLNAMTTPRRYTAIDISEKFLAAAAHKVALDYPEIDVVPLCADYTRPLSLPAHPADGPVVGFFPGSTIGNFSPPHVVGFLKRARRALGPSWFIVGADSSQREATLLQAYAGAAGLMAALHENVLLRMRRDLGAKLNPDDFCHEARVLRDPTRVEAHLVAKRATRIQVADSIFLVKKGESIHTDTSYKLEADQFTALAACAGWQPVKRWVDDDAMLSVHLLRS